MSRAGISVFKQQVQPDRGGDRFSISIGGSASWDCKSVAENDDVRGYRQNVRAIVRSFASFRAVDDLPLI